MENLHVQLVRPPVIVRRAGVRSSRERTLLLTIHGDVHLSCRENLLSAYARRRRRAGDSMVEGVPGSVSDTRDSDPRTRPPPRRFLVSLVVRGGETGGGTCRAVNVHDAATDATDQMVVVIRRRDPQNAPPIPRAEYVG